MADCRIEADDLADSEDTIFEFELDSRPDFIGPSANGMPFVETERIDASWLSIQSTSEPFVMIGAT